MSMIARPPALSRSSSINSTISISSTSSTPSTISSNSSGSSVGSLPTRLKRSVSLPFGEGDLSNSKITGQKRLCSTIDPKLDIDSPEKRSRDYDPTYSQAIDAALRSREHSQLLPGIESLSEIQSERIMSKLKMDMEMEIENAPSEVQRRLIEFRHRRVHEEMVSSLVTDSMHNILIDWLSEYSRTLNFQQSTYFLAIHLLDRYLYLAHIQKKNFQLLGCVCIFLAAKMEEQKPPLIDEVLEYSSFSFKADAFRQMEREVLEKLKFELHIPTRFLFGERYALAANLTPKERSMLMFILEFSFRDFSLNSHYMSMVAAAALHYTLQLLRPRKSAIWTDALVFYTSYNEDQLTTIVRQLRIIHSTVFGAKISAYQEYEKAAHHHVGFVEPIMASDLRFDYMQTSGSPCSVARFSDLMD